MHEMKLLCCTTGGGSHRTIWIGRGCEEKESGRRLRGEEKRGWTGDNGRGLGEVLRDWGAGDGVWARGRSGGRRVKVHRRQRSGERGGDDSDGG
jgi:hypothetical protein